MIGAIIIREITILLAILAFLQYPIYFFLISRLENKILGFSLIVIVHIIGVFVALNIGNGVFR